MGLRDTEHICGRPGPGRVAALSGVGTRYQICAPGHFLSLCADYEGGEMAVATLENWVDDRQSAGRYTFLRQEAAQESGLSAEAVKIALQRSGERGRIAKAKSYFFVIVPLEYAAAGAPPTTWFVHDLMRAMALPYYVGLLSAAGLMAHLTTHPRSFNW